MLNFNTTIYHQVCWLCFTFYGVLVNHLNHCEGLITSVMDQVMRL